jgi:hypothetical protein
MPEWHKDRRFRAALLYMLTETPEPDLLDIILSGSMDR